ncbi:hypothetical protein F4679DRAFT_565495 [Xylaria curta]|nr:hypothetical protein F4679DRAFT_565495 [Xylaria curta]
MVTGENPFIRFKNHIDNNVRRCWDSLFGSPPSSTSAATSSPDLVSPPPPSSSSSSSMPSSSKMTDRPSTTMASAAEEPDQKNTTMNEVHTWSIQSPYSPLNLQNLPQPIPRGAAGPPLPSTDVTFTFRDAFEDLLIAGSGRPLPSMRELVWKKRREVHPFWERDLHVSQWVGRLAGRGLWDAYFPLEKPHEDVERQLYFREGNRPAAPVWMRRRDDDAAGGGASWDDMVRRAADADANADRWNSSSSAALDEAKGVLDAIWKVATDQDLWKGGDDGDGDGDGDDRDRGKAADIEEELYHGTRSTTTTTSKPPPPPLPANNNRALEKDPKTGWRVTELPPPPPSQDKQPSTPEVTTTVYADGSKRIKTTSRFSRDGKTKVTTVAQHFDSAGNLVSESRETSTTRTWSGGIPGAEASFSWSWNNDHRRKSDDNSGHEDKDVDDRWSGRKEEKKGWFWNW